MGLQELRSLREVKHSFIATLAFILEQNLGKVKIAGKEALSNLPLNYWMSTKLHM